VAVEKLNIGGRGLFFMEFRAAYGGAARSGWGKGETNKDVLIAENKRSQQPASAPETLEGYVQRASR
jgi:hypothetical protein